jgi:hypothetical protein
VSQAGTAVNPDEHETVLEAFDRDGGAMIETGSGGLEQAVSNAQSIRPADNVIFSPNLQVDDIATNKKNFLPEAERLADGSLAVVWTAAVKYTAYGDAIRFSLSTDRGETWGPSVEVAEKSETGQSALYTPNLAELEDGTLGVVWGNDLWFKRSLDGGATWTGLLQLLSLGDSSGGSRISGKPVIVGVGDTFILTYAEGGNTFSMRSLDGGLTWSTPAQVTPAPSDTDYVDSGLSWDPVHERLLTIYDVGEVIYVIPSDDLGQTWGLQKLISTPGAVHTNFPALAIGTNGHCYAAWNQVEGGSDTEIYATVSTDGGLNWSTPQQVDDGIPPGNQYEPHLCVDDAGTAHITWIWNVPGQGDIDLYYSRSTDGGATWMTPQPRVNDEPYTVAPRVAFTSDIIADPDGTVYLFWNDTRNGIGYPHIMFSRGEESPWTDVGFGLAGTGGAVPKLEGSGPLTGGSMNRIELTNALPDSVTYLAIGLSVLEKPFKGGVLVPSPDLILPDLPVDSGGNLSLPFTWPDGIPAGSNLWFQHWILDPGGPQGFAASNGLMAEAQ